MTGHIKAVTGYVLGALTSGTLIVMVYLPVVLAAFLIVSGVLSAIFPYHAPSTQVYTGDTPMP